MEAKMIDFATKHKLIYDDYFISSRGLIYFRCISRSKQEFWYVVESTDPFKVISYIPA